MSTGSQPRTQTTGPDMRLIGVVVAIVVALAVIAFAVIAGGDDDEGEADGAQFGAVTTTGGELPPLPEVGEDPAVGMPGPTLVSERPGGTVTVEPGGGEPMMLMFLAHWCPHCQAEVPKIVDLAEAGDLDGIRTVAVLTSTDSAQPNYPPSAWLDEEGWEADRLYDDEANTAAAAYGVTSFPFTVFLDADGEVTQRFAGGRAEAEILAAVEAAQ